MPLELFRTTGSDTCAVTFHEEEGDWCVRLDDACKLVECFMNLAYLPLLTDDTREIRQRQAMFFRRAFADPSLDPLRNLVNHVLVCETPRGFDPVIRLAAYTFLNGESDLLGCAETRELETSVVGSRAAAGMAQNWNALAEAYAARRESRAEIFQALLDDAAEKEYPFELGVSARYPSLGDVLRMLVGNMIESRRLLRRCPTCMKYFPADALPLPCVCACGEQAAVPQSPQG